jgi:catechol 2,3-dioxygenase-like lactoylglutathione lyase family enzyme
VAITQGINHLGLSVKDLDQTVSFFVECLGWDESGRDDSYPRSAVSDGVSRLTLWEVDHSLEVNVFNFRKNIGIHHLALAVQSEEILNDLSLKVKNYNGVVIEFMPELLGYGPRKHMIFYEPGGIRLELIWSGE